MKVRCTIHKASRVLDKREEAVAPYLPIGGGAEGRGGSSSGKRMMLDYRKMRRPLEKGQAEGQG